MFHVVRLWSTALGSKALHRQSYDNFLFGRHNRQIICGKTGKENNAAQVWGTFGGNMLAVKRAGWEGQ